MCLTIFFDIKGYFLGFEISKVVCIIINKYMITFDGPFAEYSTFRTAISGAYLIFHFVSASFKH